MSYYIDQTTSNVLDFIHNEYSTSELIEKMQDRDGFYDELNDILWIDDSVTGNGSGEYACTQEEAKEYILSDVETVIDAIHVILCM